ncbi:MAG: ATPase [Agromyces sp.]
MTTTTGSLDRIEQQIDIDAAPERVWELVSTAGWWINDDRIVDHRIEEQGSRVVVHDEKHGAFTLAVEALDAPRYAAFRWFNSAPTTETPDPVLDPLVSTLVEFWIEERPGGAVLRVAESGFEGLDRDAEERRRMFDGNTEGWAIELGFARDHLAHDPAASR